MSLPFKIITCSGCDYVQLSIIAIQDFYWQGDQGHEYSIGRRLGVCNGCKEVVAMEEFPPADEYENAKAVFLAGRFRKFALRTFRKPDRLKRDLVSEALHPDGRFAALMAVMELHRNPVCLFCGSSDIAKFADPDWDKLSPTEALGTNTKHPGCGGELLVRSSGGRRIGIARSKRIYDIHGALISGKADIQIVSGAFFPR